MYKNKKKTYLHVTQYPGMPLSLINLNLKNIIFRKMLNNITEKIKKEKKKLQSNSNYSVITYSNEYTQEIKWPSELIGS